MICQYKVSAVIYTKRDVSGFIVPLVVIHQGTKGTIVVSWK